VELQSAISTLQHIAENIPLPPMQRTVTHVEAIAALAHIDALAARTERLREALQGLMQALDEGLAWDGDPRVRGARIVLEQP